MSKNVTLDKHESSFVPMFPLYQLRGGWDLEATCAKTHDATNKYEKSLCQIENFIFG